jgi:hypothetical protein
MEADHEYFERRATEERAAAAKAASPQARTAHFELAERYQDLAEALGEYRAKMG